MREKKWIYDKIKNHLQIVEGASLWPRAFQGYRAVREITLPEGIEVLPEGCFRQCVSLERIILPASLKVIGKDCFRDCENLQEIVLPDGIETIEEGAFAHCKALSKVQLPQGLQRLGAWAFHRTAIEEIRFPESLAQIDDGAFLGADALVSLALPDGLLSLGEHVFPNTGVLKEIVVSENHPSFSLRNGVLYDKAGTTMIAIPPKLPIKKLDLAEGVETIGAFAAEGQAFLEEVRFPQSIKTISKGAFACSALRFVHFIGDGASLVLEDGHAPGRERDLLLRTGVFSGCRHLRHISLPQKLRRIPNWSFLESGLSSIAFPEALQEIGRGAFAAVHFKEIRIPEGVAFVDYGAFYGTDDLWVPQSVRSSDGDLANLAGASPMHSWPPDNWHNHWLQAEGEPPLWFGAADDMGRVVLQSLFIHDQLDIQAYDAAFTGATGIENRVYMAITRLLNDVDLSEVARGRYTLFLQSFAIHMLRLMLAKQDIQTFRALTRVWSFPAEKWQEAFSLCQASGNANFIQCMMQLQPTTQRKRRRL